jgi:hypothetical protein
MSYRQRFQSLTALLAAWQPFWRPLPFQRLRPVWTLTHPQLYRYLSALDSHQCQQLEADPLASDALSPWLPVAELAELTRLPRCSASPATLPNRWSQHVGGRKWQQIEAFLAQVPEKPAQPLVEWCAGKAHLARALGRLQNRPVKALEWQATLCQQGQRLAERQGVALTLIRQNVLSPDVARWLAPQTQVLALHACGDLHVQLLHQAAQAGCDVILAPCCYQRTAARRYRPLSRLGRRLAAEHGLQLERDDLALAVQETVTAPPSVSRQRQRANAWRLGFDLLQRDVRGQDGYLPVPSLAYGRLPADFSAFCHWAASQKDVPLPKNVAWDYWEQAGWRRLQEVQRLELVRHLFRRPLEIWLALDRLMMLEEAGYQVSLGVFCERELTPRNLLLQGTAPG